MNRRFYIVLVLLAVCVSSMWAEDADTLLTCGKWATITATPDEGYHFVQWSDGVTDNPRRVQIDSDILFEAEFARDCYEPQIPVIRMYDWVLMLNVDSLHDAGWQFAGTDVSWYRIVDDADDPESVVDDEWLVDDYFLSLDMPFGGTGDYYALVHLTTERDIYLCSNTVRSEIVCYRKPPAEEAAPIRLTPTYLRVGEQMYLLGLDPEREITIRVFDPAGRQLSEHRSLGTDSYALYAEDIEGVYMVQVDDGIMKQVFKYVATQ